MGPIVAEAIEQRSVNTLIPYAKIGRTHSPAQISQIIASIVEFGFTNPILIDSEGGIVAGHGRVMAAKEMGLATVPCIVLGHLTPAQRQAYVIADNKLALNAGWNFATLTEQLCELEAMDFDVALTGFSPKEFAGLTAKHNAGHTDPDATPSPPADSAAGGRRRARFIRTFSVTLLPASGSNATGRRRIRGDGSFTRCSC